MTVLPEINALYDEQDRLSAQIKEKRKAFKESIKAENAAFERAESEILALVAREVSVDADDLYLGYWECEGSPTGQCIYNDTEDSMHDCCLICEDPAERK